MLDRDFIIPVTIFLKADAITIEAGESLQHAASRMRNHGTDVLIVIPPDGRRKKPIGILQEHTLVTEVLAQGVDLSSLKVADLMTQEPVTCGEHQQLGEVLCLMRSSGAPRIPAVDAQGFLKGSVNFENTLGYLHALIGALLTLIHPEDGRFSDHSLRWSLSINAANASKATWQAPPPLLTYL